LNLSAKDCSPFDVKLSKEDTVWLERLAVASGHGDIVVRLEDGREDEPVVACDPDGTWRAGRYVGSLTFEGRRLDIRPRFGEETLRSWFSGAFNLAVVDTPGTPADSDWFVPWLLASVWSRAFVSAARHGLPALRSDEVEKGLSLRGRLDVPGTVGMRVGGIPGASSIRREKSLNNPISAAIVSAYGELSRWLGSRREAEWMPERVKEVLPHLIGAVGWRPRTPSPAEIGRVRLTPITAGFRPLAELSVRIASRRGLYGEATDKCSCKGILLDVAELWELYVLAVLRQAWPGLDVIHGSKEGYSEALLRNDRGERLGILKPDAIVGRHGKALAIVDAKYKRLRPSHWMPAPQREDLYQLAAYLGRHGSSDESVLGMLAYPSDPTDPSLAPAEAGNPWRLNAAQNVSFLTLPHDIKVAARKIAEKIPLRNFDTY
jgi:5-methylcytosine-specific restriction enzyme subunit McrC